MKEVIYKTENLSKSFSSGGIMQHVLKNIGMELYQFDGSYGRKRGREIHTIVCAFWHGYAYPWQNHFSRAGHFQPEPGWACNVSAQALWVCISADLFDGWNVGDGQCAFGRAFAAKG